MVEKNVVNHEYLRGDGVLGLLSLSVNFEHFQHLKKQNSRGSCVNGGEKQF